MRPARPASSAPRTPARRRGATLVEFALVMPVFLMFLFGIFEYARYLMMHQLLHNAARDAARWGVVRSNSPPAVAPTAYASGDPRQSFEAAYSATRPMYKVPFIEDRFAQQAVGTERNLVNMYIRVYTVDNTTLYSDPPVIQPAPPPSASVGTPAWNQGGFSDRLAVQVVGQYTTFLPVFGLSKSINVNIIAMMGFEG